LARRRRQQLEDKHRAMLSAREVDRQYLQERCVKESQERNARFECMLEQVADPEGLRAEAGETVRAHEEERWRAKMEMHARWETEVAQRVQTQLMAIKTGSPRAGPEGFRSQLWASDDPLKSDLRAMQGEASFHRLATSILQSPRLGTYLVKSPRLYGGNSTGSSIIPNAHQRTHVECWGAKHVASNYERFDRACAAEDAGQGFHTLKRQGPGVHRVDESDGVATAGKARTRVGVLGQGLLDDYHLAREGEAARHKTQLGASSGAPLQDHYSFDGGIAILEAESPSGGKRRFPLLQGLAAGLR